MKKQRHLSSLFNRFLLKNTILRLIFSQPILHNFCKYCILLMMNTQGAIQQFIQNLEVYGMNEMTRKFYRLKRLMKKDRLAIKKTFDFQTSLFKKSNEDKPYLTLSAKGSIKFDILQLAICLSCIFLIISSVALTIKLRSYAKNLGKD